MSAPSQLTRSVTRVMVPAGTTAGQALRAAGASTTGSDRKLPVRLFDFGSVHHYEKSGVVHGLTGERMQKKIRTHTMQKVSFLLLAGSADVEASAVSCHVAVPLSLGQP